MFFALHGRDSEINAFDFYLAEKLGKTIAEVHSIPNAEYVQWISYYTIRNEMQKVQGGGYRA